MLKTSVQLRQDRAELASKARKILDSARAEKRDMKAEENQEFERMMTEVDALGATIATAEQTEQRAKQLFDLAVSDKQSKGRVSEPPMPGKDKVSKEQRKALKAEKRSQRIATDTEYRRTRPEYHQAFRTFLTKGYKGFGPTETRALQADSDIVGGYLVPPIKFVNKLILFLKDQVFIRPLATVMPVANAQALGIPSLDADPTDASWTSELQTGDEDTQMAFGRRDLTPHPLAKRLKVSNKLLRLAEDVEGLVRDRLGYKFAITEEKGFLLGTGTQQPLGVFTASTNGIPTGQDVSAGNTTTTITADGLINALYNLKAQYQARAVWIFHRNTIQQIRKLKDANGQYLWAPGLSADRPDTILNRPFYMSEYAPNTYTTGQYVGIVGDFSFYWIADSVNMAIMRLDELYAETNQTGFIARKETDGMPVLAEAFTRVKLA